MVFLAKILYWLVGVNLAAFLAFGLDKRRARMGAYRISENMLLGLAFIGGSIGAISAQHLFRHKTRKEPFRSTLYGIAVLQVAGIAVWLIWPELPAALSDHFFRG